jgi:hypothetical protein
MIQVSERWCALVRGAPPPGQQEPAAARSRAGLPGYGDQRVRRGRKRLAELSCLDDVELPPRTPGQILQP